MWCVWTAMMVFDCAVVDTKKASLSAMGSSIDYSAVESVMHVMYASLAFVIYA
jgi:hypothetical protein